MGKQQDVRSKALDFIRERDLEGLVDWAKSARNALAVLSSFIYEEDDLIRSRAIEALGQAAAGRDLEAVRSVIRKLFWSMNDDSGSVGWHAPEAIAEILFNVPALIDEYGVILAGFLRKAPFERGVHWAVWRLAPLRPEIVEELKAELGDSLENADPHIRAYAAAAFRLLGEQPKALDDAAITVYDFDNGSLKETTVSKFAQSD